MTAQAAIEGRFLAYDGAALERVVVANAAAGETIRRLMRHETYASRDLCVTITVSSESLVSH